MAKPKKLSLTEVKNHEDFGRLSRPQKLFVSLHVARDGKDALGAARLAYPHVSPKNIKSFKCQVLRSPKIQRVLNVWLGRNEMDVLAGKIEPLLDIAIKRDKKRGRISTSTERAISIIASHVKSKSKDEPAEDHPDIGSTTEASMIQSVIGKKFKQEGVWYEVVAQEIKK